MPQLRTHLFTKFPSPQRALPVVAASAAAVQWQQQHAAAAAAVTDAAVAVIIVVAAAASAPASAMVAAATVEAAHLPAILSAIDFPPLPPLHRRTGTSSFFVACYVTLHPTLSVRRLVEYLFGVYTRF